MLRIQISREDASPDKMVRYGEGEASQSRQEGFGRGGLDPVR